MKKLFSNNVLSVKNKQTNKQKDVSEILKRDLSQINRRQTLIVV